MALKIQVSTTPSCSALFPPRTRISSTALLSMLFIFPKQLLLSLVQPHSAYFSLSI